MNTDMANSQNQRGKDQYQHFFIDAQEKANISNRAGGSGMPNKGAQKLTGSLSATKIAQPCTFVKQP